jgi:hypothetical protein
MTDHRPFIFVEGETEERILRIMGCPFEPKNCKGNDNIQGYIRNDLENEFVKKKPISILILRDREDKVISDIVKSYKSFFDDLLKAMNVSVPPFRKHDDFENLYMLDVPQIEFHVILHIAVSFDNMGLKFNSDTFDGYIFALAMCEQVIQYFAKKAGISSDKLKIKVMKEIPEIAKNNGIEFNHPKDMLGVYMAMSRFLKIKRSEKDELFSTIVVKQAKNSAESEYSKIMKSTITAIELLKNKTSDI